MRAALPPTSAGAQVSCCALHARQTGWGAIKCWVLLGNVEGTRCYTVEPCILGRPGPRHMAPGQRTVPTAQSPGGLQHPHLLWTQPESAPGHTRDHRLEDSSGEGTCSNPMGLPALSFPGHCCIETSPECWTGAQCLPVPQFPKSTQNCMAGKATEGLWPGTMG